MCKLVEAVIAFIKMNLILQELELYDRRLIGRPALLAINKMDKRRSHYLLEEFKKKMENWKGFIVLHFLAVP